MSRLCRTRAEARRNPRSVAEKTPRRQAVGTDSIFKIRPHEVWWDVVIMLVLDVGRIAYGRAESHKRDRNTAPAQFADADIMFERLKLILSQVQIILRSQFGFLSGIN